MNPYICSCQEYDDMNTQKMLSVIAIVTVVTITTFGSFAVVTMPALGQENMTSGGMMEGGNMTGGANMTGGNMSSMMSNALEIPIFFYFILKDKDVLLNSFHFLIKCSIYISRILIVKPLEHPTECTLIIEIGNR
jgi:hypothetical protein